MLLPHEVRELRLKALFEKNSSFITHFIEWLTLACFIRSPLKPLSKRMHVFSCIISSDLVSIDSDVINNCAAMSTGRSYSSACVLFSNILRSLVFTVNGGVYKQFERTVHKTYIHASPTVRQKTDLVAGYGNSLIGLYISNPVNVHMQLMIHSHLPMASWDSLFARG